MLKFIGLVLLLVSLCAATYHLPGYNLNPFSAVHFDRTNKNLYLGTPQIYSLGPKPSGGCRILQRIHSDVNATSFAVLHPNSYDRLVVSNNYAQTNKRTYNANHLHQQLFHKNGSLFECDSMTANLPFGFRYIVPSQNSTNTIYAIVSSCPNNYTYNRIIKVNLDTLQYMTIYKSSCSIYNLKLLNNRLFFAEDSFTCAKSGFADNGITSINVDGTGLSKSLSWSPADFEVTKGIAILFNIIGVYTCTITNQFNFTNCHKIISYSQYPIYTGTIGDNNTIYYLENNYNNCSLLYSATFNGSHIQPVIKNSASSCKFGANMTFSAFTICQRIDSPTFCNSFPPAPSPTKSTSCFISIPILLIVGVVLALLICKCVLLCRSRRRCRMARQYAMVNTVAPTRVDIERVPLTQDTDPSPTYPMASNFALGAPSYPQAYVQAIPVPSAPVVVMAPPRTSYQPVYSTPTIILVDNE